MAKRLGQDVEAAFRAIANDKRLLILHWLRNPAAHFSKQVEGDLVIDGVCGVQIAEKLKISQPTVSAHLKILLSAGLLRGKKIKQWTFYRRDEHRISAIKKKILQDL